MGSSQVFTLKGVILKRLTFFQFQVEKYHKYDFWNKSKFLEFLKANKKINQCPQRKYLKLPCPCPTLPLGLAMVVKVILLWQISWANKQEQYLYSTPWLNHITAKMKVIACVTILSLCVGMGKKHSKSKFLLRTNYVFVNQFNTKSSISTIQKWICIGGSK